MIIEEYKVKGVTVNVIRGDKEYRPPLPQHIKMGALEQLVVNVKRNGFNTIGCFCTSHGIWQFGLPHFASEQGLKSILCYPSNKPDAVIEKLKKYVPKWKSVENLEVKLFRPNMVAVNSAQAKNYIEQQGGYYLPFGINHPDAVDFMSKQIILPKRVGTLVVPCGSGVTLAAVLRSISLHETKAKRIEAVPAHYPRVDEIVKTVLQHEWVPENLNWRSIYKYDDIPDTKCPWPAHPYYELKAYDWLYSNIKRLPSPIYFLNIGAE